MIKRYVYKGTVYRTANALRKAVWHSEHKVFDREPEENKIEFWKKLGVAYTEELEPEPSQRVLTMREPRA